MTSDQDKAICALVRKLDEVHASPEWKGVWTLHMVHGGKYAGPTYDKELDLVRHMMGLVKPVEDTPDGEV